MKDYFEELIVNLQNKKMNISHENIKKHNKEYINFLFGYDLSDEVLFIYNHYGLFELTWFAQDEKYRGFIQFIPYDGIEAEHQELIEMMKECYDIEEDYLKIKDDIENWYPLFKFPNGDMFCMDARNGKIVFYEHEVYDTGINLHGLIIALSVNDLFEKWSKCYFADIYDWYEGTDDNGIDLQKEVFKDLLQ